MIDKKALAILCLSLVIFWKLGLAEEEIPAPNFKLQDIDQDTITLSNYKSKKPVVLMFCTTWCPMCPTELRNLNNIYLQLTKDNIEVLAIDSGELPDEVEDFVKNYFLAYRVLLDKDTAVTQSYSVIGFPIYVLINKDGEIVFKDTYFPVGQYRKLLLNEE